MAFGFGFGFTRDPPPASPSLPPPEAPQAVFSEAANSQYVPLFF